MHSSAGRLRLCMGPAYRVCVFVCTVAAFRGVGESKDWVPVPCSPAPHTPAPTGALKFWFVCFSSFIFICLFKVPACVVCQPQAPCVWPGHLASSACHRTALSRICFPFVCIAGGGACPLGLACAHPCVYPPLSPCLFFLPRPWCVCVCRAVSRVYPLHSYACTSVPRLAAVPTCVRLCVWGVRFSMFMCCRWLGLAFFSLKSGRIPPPCCLPCLVSPMR